MPDTFNQKTAIDALNAPTFTDANAETLRTQVRLATVRELHDLVTQIQASPGLVQDRFDVNLGHRETPVIRNIIADRVRELRLQEGIGPWHTINENLATLRTRVTAEVDDAHNALRNLMDTELRGPGPQEYGLALYNALKSNDADRLARFGKILEGKFVDHGRTPPAEVQFDRPNLAAMEAFATRVKDPTSEYRLGITERDAVRSYVNGQLLTNPRTYNTELARYPHLKDLMNDTSLNDVPAALSSVAQPVASIASTALNTLTGLLPSGVGAFVRDMRDGLLGAHPLEQARNLGMLISTGASKLLWGSMAASPIPALSRLGKKHQVLNRVETAVENFQRAQPAGLRIDFNRNVFLNAYTPPATGPDTTVWEDLVNRFLQAEVSAGRNPITLTMEKLREDPTVQKQRIEQERTKQEAEKKAKDEAEKKRLEEEARQTQINNIKAVNLWGVAQVSFGDTLSARRNATTGALEAVTIPTTGNHFTTDGNANSDEARALRDAITNLTSVRQITVVGPEVPLEITRSGTELQLKLPRDMTNLRQLNEICTKFQSSTLTSFKKDGTMPPDHFLLRLSPHSGGRHVEWNGQGDWTVIGRFFDAGATTPAFTAVADRTTWAYRAATNTWTPYTPPTP